MTRICVLSSDPDEAVQWLTDADILRMPIEVAQVLLSIWHKHDPGRFPQTIAYLAGDPWLEWANASVDNYTELWNYAMDLVDEHYHRFGSRQNPPYKHGIHLSLERLQEVPPLPEVGPTDMPISPEQARLAYNPTGTFDVYTHRTKPDWKL